MNQAETLVPVGWMGSILVPYKLIIYFLLTLNCLLVEYERFLSDYNMSDASTSLCSKRKKMINTYFWNTDLGYYVDYNYVKTEQTNHLTLAGVFPLTFKLADEAQAEAVASMIEQQFLAPGGVRTTTVNSGEQSDAPNGWAPLQ